MITHGSFWITLAAALLSGCSVGLGVRVDSAAAPYFRPGPGARVVMLQQVVLQPGQLRAFFQNGRQVTRNELNPHYPNCNLELNTLSDATRTVPPGTYAVIRTERRHAPLAGLPRVQVAATGPLPPVGMRSGGSPTINFETRFFLAPGEGGSEDIRALNCAQWGEPGGITDYPTAEEIARALGEVGRLEL